MELKEHFYMRVADLDWEIYAENQDVVSFTREYHISKEEARHAIPIRMTEEKIARACKDQPEFPREMNETTAVHREMGEILPKKQRMLFHGGLLSFLGEGILFTAGSGVGKSTHMKLWKKYLGDKVEVVNGDKPILWIKDETCFAYGTPWAGKEGWQKNCKRELKRICIVTRGKENKIRKLESKDALTPLLSQFYLPENQEGAMLSISLLDQLLKILPVYELSCNISKEAVEVCLEGMTGYKLKDLNESEDDRR